MKLLTLNHGKYHSILISFLLVGVFVMTRILSLLTAVDMFQYPEELLRGSMGKAILEGSAKVILEYRIDHYSGGYLLVGTFAAFFFKLFGTTLFALKLVPLIFFFAPSAALAFVFLNKYFGLKTAVFCLLLFIFPVPTLTQISLVAMGFHSESILVTLGIYACYYFLRESQGMNYSLIFIFGILSGLGLWFAPIVGLSLAACFLSDAADKKIFFRPLSFLLLGASFMVGLLPTILHNINHEFDMAHFLANAFISRARFEEGVWAFFVAFGKRFVYCGLSELPQSFGFERFFGYGTFMANFYLIISVVAWVGLSIDFYSRGVLKKWLPILLYPIIFLLAYAASALPVGSQLYLPESRYFIPMQFFILLIIGMFAAGKGKFRKLLYSCCLLMGMAAYLALVFRGSFGQAFNYLGYYKQMSEVVQPQRGYQLSFFPELQKTFMVPSEWISSPLASTRCYALSRIGEKAALKNDLSSVREVMKGYAPDDQVCFYSGFAKNFLLVRDDLNQITNLQEKSQDFFYMNRARFLLDQPNGALRHKIENQVDGMPDREIIQLMRGLGVWSVENFWQPGLKNAKTLLDYFDFAVPKRYLNEFYWGVGWGLGADLNCNRLSLQGWIDRLPGNERDWAMAGFKSIDEFYHISKNCAVQ